MSESTNTQPTESEAQTQDNTNYYQLKPDELFLSLNNLSYNMIYLIDEKLIPDILTFLQVKSNPIQYKSFIVQFLKTAFTKICFNVEIFLNFTSNCPQKMYLYEIIIYQILTNKKETEYFNELKALLNILLSNTSYNFLMYKYIFSFVTKFTNNKQALIDEKPNDYNDLITDFTSDIFATILELISIFLQGGGKLELPSNYFYFSGEENCNITLNNIDKKKMNLSNDLCVLMYIKLMDNNVIKKTSFSLLEIKISETRSIKININDEKSKDKDIYNIPFSSFAENKTNQVLIKINITSKIDIYINNKLQEALGKTGEKINGGKIDSFIFLSDFIGICSNIIIFKNNYKDNGMPKILLTEFYKNGLYKEELYISFVKAELLNEVDDGTIFDKSVKGIQGMDINEFKNFIDKFLIALYMPTRFDISNDDENNPKSPIILKDSINNFDAFFNISATHRTGVHYLKNALNSFFPIGGVNHLLPLFEIVNLYPELLTKENLNLIMAIIIYVFNNLSSFFRVFDKNSSFFYYLSYFLEKIPADAEYSFDLCDNLKKISVIFLGFINDPNYASFSRIFHGNIILNEKILFKFKEEDQRTFINQINNIIKVQKPSQPLISIDIIKIIKILLHYDKNRYLKYCCKEHASFFTDNKEIMSPALNEYIEPVFDLIKEVSKHYISEFNKDKSENGPPFTEGDENLCKLFELLTFDISPCLQKAILHLFLGFKNIKYLSHLNKHKEILVNVLFLMKSSLTEIKIDAFEFVMQLMNKIDNVNSLDSTIKNYIEYNLLPFFLFDENMKTEYDKEIKEYIFIHQIKYNLLSLKPLQGKIIKNYNKQKILELKIQLFDKIYFCFNLGININMNLNLLVRLASKSDIRLVIKLIEKINLELEVKSKRSIEKNNEIKNNQFLLHWLLEISFHAYLLINNKNINSGDNKSYYGFSFPEDMNEEFRLSQVNKVFELTNKLLLSLFLEDILKLDYLLSWSKYYYEIKEHNNSFGLNRDFIFKYFLEPIFAKNKDFNKADINNNSSQKKTLYLINILFEYYTYYKLTAQENNENIKDEDLLFLEISVPFRHFIFSELKQNKDQNNNNLCDNLISKQFPNYSFLHAVYSVFLPLFKDNNKKIKDDKNFFSTYIHNKKNTYINELELLFYSFTDIKELNQEESQEKIISYSNKGIPLIYIFYHYITIFLTVVKNKDEFKEYIDDFRQFLSMVIISSCTLAVSKAKEKEKGKSDSSNAILWPNEDQYKEIQQNIKIFIFNCFYFLYYAIQDINEHIKQSETQKDEKALENNNTIKKYLIDTVCYFLRLLNTIYKEVKKINEKKNKNNFKAMFNMIKSIVITEKEGIQLSGPFLFMQEFYSQCINLNPANENNTISFIDPLPIFNIDDMYSPKEGGAYLSEYPKLEAVGDFFIKDTRIKQYFSDFGNKYQKQLFPFIKYMIKRKEKINTIIPIYDNSIYVENKNVNVCLLPNYIPDYMYDKQISNAIDKINEEITKDFQMDQIKEEIDNNNKIKKYYRIKKRLFIFSGFWSNKKLFYDEKKIKKYCIKYKLLNHLTEDYTRIFLTPIIDSDFYLPKFNAFDTKELFRNIENKISLEKITDLSTELAFDKTPDKANEEEEEKKEQQEKQGEENKIEQKNEITQKEEEEKKEEGNKDEINKEEINKEEVNKIEEEKKEGEINEKKEEEKDNKDNKENKDNINQYEIIEDYNIKDIINDEENEKKYNSFYLIRNLYYKYVDTLDNKEKNNTKLSKLFLTYLKKINNVNLSENDSQEVCCLVKAPFHIKGIFYNNKSEIGFYCYDKIPFSSQEEYEYDTERKACFGSVFGNQNYKYNNQLIKIPYGSITFILKRRYFFKTIALEVFTLNKKSYFFKFNEKNFKKVYDNLRANMKSNSDDLFIEYSKTDYKVGFINTKNSLYNIDVMKYKRNSMNLKNLYDKWASWGMSTLKFLMLMNIYANRSYNDINQYPVFPWIVTNYKDKKYDHNSLTTEANLIRPFGTPMGMMDFTPEALNRKNNFLEHWQSMEEDEEKDINNQRYGSHYSTSSYVSYYLVRIFPFSQIRIELQGSKFDDPNRLFLSMDNSFNCSITQKTDLRELIPEIFCFPEMFYNINDLNLGSVSENPNGEGTNNLSENENGNENNNEKLIPVENVELPKWANNDGYLFIKRHRELLESPEISDKINEWFNIIFGSKQKGKEAKKINNLFLNQTYDDFEEEHDKSKTEDKIYQYRMVEFGVTPNQIFKFDTNKRKQYYDTKNKNQLLYNISEEIKSNTEINNINNSENNNNNNNYIIEGSSSNFTFVEIDLPFTETAYRIFHYKKKDERKKKRIYILTESGVKIYKKIIEKIKRDENGKEIVEQNLNDSGIKASASPMTKEIIKLNLQLKDEVSFKKYNYRVNNDISNKETSLVFAKGSLAVFGGYWNGNIVLKNIEYKNKTKDVQKKTYIYTTNEFSPITKIVMNVSETFVACSNKLGTMFIFYINSEIKYEWRLYKIIFDQKTEISAMALDETLNVLITCSNEGFCMLYTIPNCKFFNSWKISPPQKIGGGGDDGGASENSNIFCPVVIVIPSPLPCYFFYIKNLNCFYVYSINGKFLMEHKIDYEVSANGIRKYVDSQARDYLLIYNTKNKTIDIHRGIEFKMIARSPVINYQFIDFVISKDLDQVIILVENNNEEDPKKAKIKYKLLLLKDQNIELIWK